MNLTELAACVALIADDAEHRFSRTGDAPHRDAYAREAVFDLWLTRPGLTVSAAHHVLRHVRAALMRRASSESRSRLEQPEFEATGTAVPGSSARSPLANR